MRDLTLALVLSALLGLSTPSPGQDAKDKGQDPPGFKINSEVNQVKVEQAIAGARVPERLRFPDHPWGTPTNSSS